ncbi:alpha/beta fold hydrolase [Spirillospora sp. CA-255316]
MEERELLKYPLVLVPALGSDQRLWQPVIDRLADTAECVVIRGEGETIASMADGVLAQAPEKFHLAGNSMGGYVSLEIALRRTGRVAGLALLNSSAIAAPPDRRANSVRAIEMAEDGRFEEAVAGISGAVAPRRPEVSALAAAMALELGAEVFAAQQRAVLDRADRRAELADLTLPTLVLVGDQDMITPLELGEDLAKSIPDAELVVLEGVGHLSALEDPDRVASHLSRWLRRSEDRARFEAES